MTSFSQQIRQFRVDFSTLSHTVARIATLKLFGRIVKVSPVDTGRFRANWFATIGTASSQTDLNSRGTVDAVNRRIEAVVIGASTASVFWLTNNLPYAETLEFGLYPGDGPKTVGGFSTQAPAGVVRVTALEFSRILEQNAAVLSRL